MMSRKNQEAFSASPVAGGDFSGASRLAFVQEKPGETFFAGRHRNKRKDLSIRRDTCRKAYLAFGRTTDTVPRRPCPGHASQRAGLHQKLSFIDDVEFAQVPFVCPVLLASSP
jgi:hypothetical protein